MRAISNAVLDIALSEAEGSIRIDIVFDVYKDVSIKNTEQQKRSNSVEVILYKTLFPSQVVQQWDSFKASSVNKANLIRFIASEWSGEWKTVYVGPNWESATLLCLSRDEQCFRIMSNMVELVPELESSQEEADTAWCFIWPTYLSMISPVQSLPVLMQVWLSCALLTTINSLCPCSKSVVQKLEWSMLIQLP